jgi:hypothetical protein
VPGYRTGLKGKKQRCPAYPLKMGSNTLEYRGHALPAPYVQIVRAHIGRLDAALGGLL